MKKSLYVWVLALVLIGTSCNKYTSDADVATFNLGNASYTSSNPSITVNTSYGTTYNTLTFPLSSGAKLVLNFKGSSASTYYLQNTSYYQDSNGNMYYGSSYSNTISVTNYDIVNSVPVLSGTFTFSGYASGSYIEITNGKFTKVTN
jgi:hypothetical protein